MGAVAVVAAWSSSVAWTGTFLLLLLPGVVVGLLPGQAEHLRRTTGNPRGPLLVWSPVAAAGRAVEATSGARTGSP